ARGWIVARRPRVGLATLLSRWSGARKSDGRNDGRRNAHLGTHGTSLRRGFSRQAISRGSSRVCLAGALFAGYEGGPVDGVPVRPSPERVRQTLKKRGDRKSTRLNSSHQIISYAVFCSKKKKRAI